MHKATPITQRASAIKQTYNPDLVAGARRSAGKFQDTKIKPPIEEDPEKEEINPDLEQEETETPPTPGDGSTVETETKDPNAPDTAASGKGGGDGTKPPKSRKQDRKDKREIKKWLNKGDKDTGLTGQNILDNLTHLF